MKSKINIKNLQFGSKIDKNSKKREEYFSVKEIISPSLLQLNTSLIIKLIGVKADTNMSEEAMSFIEEKTKGHKVYMRFDNIKYDDHNNLLCYLYLDNRTFINAHLLKQKLSIVDTTMNYKLQI